MLQCPQNIVKQLKASVRSHKLMFDSGAGFSGDRMLKGFMSDAVLTNILGDRTI